MCTMLLEGRWVITDRLGGEEEGKAECWSCLTLRRFVGRDLVVLTLDVDSGTVYTQGCSTQNCLG